MELFSGQIIWSPRGKPSDLWSGYIEEFHKKICISVNSLMHEIFNNNSPQNIKYVYVVSNYTLL